MDVREKLLELIAKAKYICANDYSDHTEDEYIADTLLDNERMFGFCYTQLYDIEQEQNGLYTYSREPKFDMEIFRKINSRKAAIEK